MGFINIVQPYEADIYIRAYQEDDGTFDVDVYFGDERDDEYSIGHVQTWEEAVKYAEEIAEKLSSLGAGAVYLKLEPHGHVVRERDDY